MTQAVVWQGWTRSELDAAYDNRAAVPDSAARLAQLAAQSQRARQRAGALLELRYGRRPRQRLDYFPGGQRHAPVLVFVHGGYWQANDKEMFAALAVGPCAVGLDVAVVGYTLAPEAGLAEIVAEIGEAVDWLVAWRASRGHEPDGSVILAGWSAGAHLAVMNVGLPAVRMGLLLSGVYDLEPCRLGRINDRLGLGSAAQARALSPIHQLDTRWPPLVLAYGTSELPALQAQSEAFFEAGCAHGCTMVRLPLPGANHFTILDELARPGGRLLDCLAP